MSSRIRRLKAKALDQPAMVIESAELTKRLNQFQYGTEGMHPEQLFLQNFEEAFDTAVAFRFPDEGGIPCGESDRLCTRERR